MWPKLVRLAAHSAPYGGIHQCPYQSQQCRGGHGLSDLTGKTHHSLPRTIEVHGLCNGENWPLCGHRHLRLLHQTQQGHNQMTHNISI